MLLNENQDCGCSIALVKMLKSVLRISPEEKLQRVILYMSLCHNLIRYSLN